MAMKTLVVDPIACDGRGLCAELLPEWVTLDDWGYPMINPEPLPGHLLAHARRAVAACPTLALSLLEPPRRDPVAPGRVPTRRP
jgi:ferredoxin